MYINLPGGGTLAKAQELVENIVASGIVVIPTVKREAVSGARTTTLTRTQYNPESSNSVAILAVFSRIYRYYLATG